MIEIVSTKTLRARDPDHKDRTNPSESRSKRPSLNTSDTVGASVEEMTWSVRNRLAKSSIAVRTSLTVSGPSHCPT